MTSACTLLSHLFRVTTTMAVLFAARPVMAFEGQPPVDRSDPSVAIEEVQQSDAQRPIRTDQPEISRDETAEPAGSETAIVVGAIRVEGATALPPAAFAGAIEPYLGQTLAPEDLRRLARDVAAVARAAGYGLATAWIPRQNVTNGILRARIDEGRIDAVDARGPGGAVVASRLAGLAGPEPVRTAALERRLLIAGDVAGVTVGRARLVRENGRNILRIDTRHDRVSAQFTLDNWGTAAIGPWKARVVADFNGVLGKGDRFTIGGMVTPLQPREFQLLQLGYALPLGRDGTMLALRAYLSSSNAGGSLRQRDYDGVGNEGELALSHPLMRSRNASLWGYLTFGLRESSLDRDGLRLREDRIALASASLYAWARVGGSGVARARIGLTQGLDAAGATERGDPRASRPDASGVFTKATLWADYTRHLGSGFGIQLSGQGQLASRPLLASEEIGLGGRAFLRGYDYREFSGDQGIAGAVELRYDTSGPVPAIRRIQLYAYADAGRVSNLRDGFGSGSLASAGGGIRLSLPRRIDAGLELGVPLRDGFDGTRPGPRLSITLGMRF